MRFIRCLQVLLYFILIALDISDAELYELPLNHLQNDFTKNLFNRVITDINDQLDGTFVIFDVHRFQSQIASIVTYDIDLVIAASECQTETRTFANCGITGTKFERCRIKVNYLPGLTEEDNFSTTVINCHRISPTLPKYPYFLGFSLPSNVDNLFTAFQLQYNRTYSKEEARDRMTIFKRNLLKIQVLKALDNGDAEYGITPFSDLDETEFKQTHANLNWRSMPRSMKSTINVDDFNSAPSSFDWREKGAVTEVKDQGWCGSCWAFGVTGNIETQWYIKNGTLVSLSEQQLLDCDSHDEACNGGLPEWAFEAIVKMGGLMSERDYPYEAEKEPVCHLVKNNVSAHIDNWEKLPTDEAKLAAWLAQNGTITVGINANFLQFYMGGVSHPPHFLCSDKGLDHAVLLVGYGVSSILHRPYWIVKNSWGSSWGESGYFRLYRGDGTCGINTDATTSIIY